MIAVVNVVVANVAVFVVVAWAVDHVAVNDAVVVAVVDVVKEVVVAYCS